MNKILLIFAFTLFSFTINAQEIHWLNIEEAYKLNQKAPKKIVIDVYTAWCGWCKVMDKNTFQNPEVVKYVNENFYAVKMDAESTKDITLGTDVFKHDPKNNLNQLAINLLGGKMSYPSIVYLDEKFSMIQPIAGYMDAKAFHEVITFFGSNEYRNKDFANFKTGYYAQKFGNVKF